MSEADRRAFGSDRDHQVSFVKPLSPPYKPTSPSLSPTTPIVQENASMEKQKRRPLSTQRNRKNRIKVRDHYKQQAILRERISKTNPEDPASLEQALGFSSFASTKGKYVPGNVQGAADVIKRRSYRRVLHVKGIYNRPLTKQDHKTS